MENILNKTAEDFTINKKFIESNYYILTVIKIAEPFWDFDVKKVEITFNTTTKTGRNLGKEKRFINFKYNS